MNPWVKPLRSGVVADMRLKERRTLCQATVGTMRMADSRLSTNLAYARKCIRAKTTFLKGVSVVASSIRGSYVRYPRKEGHHNDEFTFDRHERRVEAYYRQGHDDYLGDHVTDSNCFEPGNLTSQCLCRNMCGSDKRTLTGMAPDMRHHSCELLLPFEADGG